MSFNSQTNQRINERPGTISRGGYLFWNGSQKYVINHRMGMLAISSR